MSFIHFFFVLVYLSPFYVHRSIMALTKCQFTNASKLTAASGNKRKSEDKKSLLFNCSCSIEKTKNKKAKIVVHLPWLHAYLSILNAHRLSTVIPTEDFCTNGTSLHRVTPNGQSSARSCIEKELMTDLNHGRKGSKFTIPHFYSASGIQCRPGMCEPELIVLFLPGLTFWSFP